MLGDDKSDGRRLIRPVAIAHASARLARLRGGRDPIWRQVLVIAWLCWLYDVLTELAPTRRALALSHARAMLSVERSVGIAPEVALDRARADELIAFAAFLLYPVAPPRR